MRVSTNVKTAVAVALLATVDAKCANDCNGKGECNALNQCDCFPNFRGPDCSFRICPSGKAFVDTPLGDIDGKSRSSIGLRIAAVSPTRRASMQRFGPCFHACMYACART